MDRKTRPKGWLSALSGGESKDPAVESMQAIGDMFVDPNVTYRFRLVRYGTISTTNTVQCLTYVTFNPTGIQEYDNYLKYLFNEVRIKKARLRLLPIGGSNMAAQVVFAVATDLGLSSVNPTALGAVVENPNCAFVSSWYVRDTEHVWTTNCQDYLYAATTSAAPSPQVGCYGQFSIAQSQAAGASEPVFYYFADYEYEFTSRT